MDVNTEEAHQMVDELGELIEDNKFKEARAVIAKFIGVLESMDYHLKTLKKK